MPPKKKRGSKPSVAKSARAKAPTAPKKKTATKKPKKVVAKKRAPKKGVRATIKKSARSSVSVKAREKESEIAKDVVAPKGISAKVVEYKAWPDSVRADAKLATQDFIRAGAFLVLVVSLLVGGYSMKAIAATFEGPTELPPAGNIPVTIWNRQSSGAKQANAEIDIDGQAQFGSEDNEIGDDGIPRNLIYGVTKLYEDGVYTMGAEDNLFLLQTVTVTGGVPSYLTRFSINRGGGVYSYSNITGNQGIISGAPNRQLGASDPNDYLFYGAARYDVSDPTNYMSHPKDDYLIWLRTRDYDAPGDPYQDRFKVNVSGDVFATGCFGPTFVGLTALSYAPSAVSGYYGANNKCQLDYPNDPGVHVCTSEEILESIKCSVDGDPIRGVVDGTSAWINGGPPGFTANANDCQGWTSSAANAYGRYWIFNLASGGRGTTTSCNSPGIPFACCR